MIGALKRGLGLVYRYTLGRGGKTPSTANFWYRQARARVFSAETLKDYFRRSEPYPLYLFDQTVKLGYPSVRNDGVVILHYGPPIGDQENPEAAFQYALGAADRFLVTGETRWRDEFLGCAAYYRMHQMEDGGFPYRFDYGACRAPWSSALAQARGVSVMLRAWMLTRDASFLECGRRAISRFDVSVEDGGFLAVFEPTDSPYYEEYPEMRSVVLNGFLSTVFGLYELSVWAKDERAGRLLAVACDSLEAMLPEFESSGWTLYDRRAGETRPNPHSPFYHEMVVEYLRVLAAIDSRLAFQNILRRWAAMDTPWNRVRALWAKLLFKVSVR